MKIGFFDSGLGGITVLKEAIYGEGLSEDIIYLGDTKNTPYGTKDEKFVYDAIMDNVEYLIQEGCNPIVVACNTATSLCIKDLRAKYKDIVFIGTEPAIKVAADAKLNKKILVLATSITVRKEKLLTLIDELKITKDVVLVPADELVKFAENINCSTMTKEENEYIKSLLEKYNLEEFSHIVLGCTHFPLFKENFKDVIKEICPSAKIEIVDGSKGISNNLIRYINKINNVDSYNANKRKITIVTTNESPTFIKRVKEILNIDDIEVECKLH